MATAKKKKEEGSTEQKIIAAARNLFTQNGYDAVKTRDIAKEAGINLALLNYYFRSKEKLFEIIMMENVQRFSEGFVKIINDEKTTYTEKIEKIVANYIEMLIIAPDTPLFILNMARANPGKIQIRKAFMSSYFLKQLQEGMNDGEIAKTNVTNVMLNIVGMSIFPFIARSMFTTGDHGINQEQFMELMQERKKMIPKWINAMLKVK